MIFRAITGSIFILLVLLDCLLTVIILKNGWGRELNPTMKKYYEKYPWLVYFMTAIYIISVMILIIENQYIWGIWIVICFFGIVVFNHWKIINKHTGN